MLGKLKIATQVFVLVALVVQLAGCFYERERRRYDEPDRYYDYNEGSSVDIHLQGH